MISPFNPRLHVEEKFAKLPAAVMLFIPVRLPPADYAVLVAGRETEELLFFDSDFNLQPPRAFAYAVPQTAYGLRRWIKAQDIEKVLGFVLVDCFGI